MTQVSEAHAAFAALLAELRLDISATFVPFSQSRNAKPDKDGRTWRSLNWRCRVNIMNGETARTVLETDYSAGEAHCPSGSAFGIGKRTRDQEERISFELENGRTAVRRFASGSISPGKPLLPSAVDVISSLARDADVLDAGGFESWASDLGHDPDSRSAEAIYRLCLEHALALRAAIGEAALTRLSEAAREL